MQNDPKGGVDELSGVANDQPACSLSLVGVPRMRQTIFIGFVLLGAALGLLSAKNESFGVQIVMATVGAVAGVAIGGALSRIGRRRRAKNVSPMADSAETTEDRVSNYWLDHGRLTAAPGLPDPDETDQISLKP
jgi:hypothetical protein